MRSRTITARRKYSGLGLVSIPLNSIKRIIQLNPRYTAYKSIDQLAASILANGQILAMLVTREDDGYAVLDGHLRWRAMLLLVEQGHWTQDQPVNVYIVSSEDPELRRDIKDAVDTIHRGLHPVEEYRAFDALVRAGLDEIRIANNFGISLQHVHQRLALGRLSPKILDAWLGGVIDADAARAFISVESQGDD